MLRLILAVSFLSLPAQACMQDSDCGSGVFCVKPDKMGAMYNQGVCAVPPPWVQPKWGAAKVRPVSSCITTGECKGAASACKKRPEWHYGACSY